MIKKLFFEIVKKHGIIFAIEILREFITEYRQSKIMDEINQRYHQNDDNIDNDDKFDFYKELVNQVKNKQ